MMIWKKKLEKSSFSFYFGNIVDKMKKKFEQFVKFTIEMLNVIDYNNI